MTPFFYRIIRVRSRKRIAHRTRRKRPVARNTHDYRARKEAARVLITKRLSHFRDKYLALDPLHGPAMQWRRIYIRNQRSRWGSCSAHKNLNFNYRILDLSPELQDYVIAHELCHLKELNHGPAFWHLMALTIPNARELNQKARSMRIE